MRLSQQALFDNAWERSQNEFLPTTDKTITFFCFVTTAIVFSDLIVVKYLTFFVSQSVINYIKIAVKC